MYCVMSQQVNQRQLVGDIVFEPEHDALVIGGIMELALLLPERSKLPFVFEGRIELIAVTVDNVARTLLEVPGPLAYWPHDIGVDIDVVIAAEAGFLQRLLQIMTATDMEHWKIAVGH